MSIREYPKHQYCVEVYSDEITRLMTIKPSFSGYVKHIRVKMITRNYQGTTGRSKLVILDSNNNIEVCSSNWVNYSEMGRAVNPLNYYHALVRFDFEEISLVKNMIYQLGIYQENYSISSNEDDGFVAYCLDHNYKVNNTDKENNPFTNPRLSAEIYLLRDYYDFE